MKLYHFRGTVLHAHDAVLGGIPAQADPVGSPEGSCQKLQVLLNECGDEIVGVIISVLHTQTRIDK